MANIVSQFLHPFAPNADAPRPRLRARWRQHSEGATMKFPLMYRVLHAGVIASAALALFPAGAQTPAPAEPAPAATPAAGSMPAAPRAHGPRPRGERPMHRRHHHRDGVEPANADRLAGSQRSSMTDYERNALARCDVFKTQDDRRACVERMHQPAQGSVSGGGLLREYTYEEPVDRP
ncbi:hypothetical protein B2J86_08285 [Acidovorax sp. SRB_14]|nr:hypothetical protein [Acidovorax sp. SRB_14]NMM89263.1 hypothetical protein [Rhodococcus sp. SRB_17]